MEPLLIVCLFFIFILWTHNNDTQEDVDDLIKRLYLSEEKVTKMQEQLDSHETSINNMVVALSVEEEENGNQ